jgi:hypothetical protein
MSLKLELRFNPDRLQYIAHKLLEINERKTYTKGESIIRIAPDDLERQKKISDQDEDIFQTARLINCACSGLELQSFLITSAAFSVLFAKAARRVLILSGSVDPHVFTLPKC